MNVNSVEADPIEGVLSPAMQPLLVGHEKVWAELESRLSQRRLPGGILLHGPKGIGKATLAYHFARQILTTTGDETRERVDAQVFAGSHPNITTLRLRPRDTGTGFFTVIRAEEVRKLRTDLHQTRGRNGYRVCVIDSVDDCNTSSANVLLKTLEEPPAEMLFILVSHRPGQLLPTIRSRCQSYALRPLSEDAVTQIVQGELAQTAPADLARAVRLAGGRPRRAFEALVLGQDEALDGLVNWLEKPDQHPVGIHLELAGALVGPRAGAKIGFARVLIEDWLAAETRQAAGAGCAGRYRLASASKLWDNAQSQFSQADIYNLDQRQTLVALFDAIRQHVQKYAPTLAG